MSSPTSQLTLVIAQGLQIVTAKRIELRLIVCAASEWKAFDHQDRFSNY